MVDTIQDNQGIERALGCLPRVSKVRDGTFRVFGDPGTDTPPLIPESQWKDYRHITLESCHWHTIDQAQQGSCCAAMGSGIIILGRELAGLTPKVMSQASLYAFDGIERNGNLIPRRSDNGMAIDTCWALLEKIGVAPVDVIAQYDWEGFLRGRWQEDWRDHSAKNRMLEVWDCPSYKHIVSANILGFPVGYGCKGHAVIRIGWEKDLNSWGPGWGNNGVGRWATRREIEASIGSYGAWAFRVVTDPTDDGDLPIAE